MIKSIQIKKGIYMLKGLLKLFIVLILANTVYANNQNMQQEVTTLKIELEKIKIIQKLENIDDKIKNISNRIENLEKKLNEGLVEKNSIKKDFENYNEIINRQDRRILDLGHYLTIFGILVMVIILLFSLGYGLIARSQAEKEVKNWIDEKADLEFQPKVEEYLKEIENKGIVLLNKIKEEADNLNIEHKNKIDEFDLMKKELSMKEKEQIKDNIESLEDKEENDYDFDDWYSKFVEEYYKNNFNQALGYIDKLFDLADKDLQKIKVFFAKGITLEKLEKNEEAIAEYDNLIARFKNSKNENILEYVASTLIHKMENLLINNQDILETFEFAKKQFVTNKKVMVKISLLNILYNSQKVTQDSEIEEWTEEYSDTLFTDFDLYELYKWSESIKEENVKERIKRYIEVFKEKAN